eukprot:CAMPEP_0183353490 /NCGR_PEP_ID=MMETSP0164_2-20130417/33280_1 /TAXON_ID=221442 /ORGANISM="Coccolithus pelagicus ssp braarudi, Strain PLY182g" /LENGTH=105 /DNA_ID=CAMNT_0025526165 /DNA_START=146 /DNA_END=460 /DNA_ORIENTATION=+
MNAENALDRAGPSWTERGAPRLHALDLRLFEATEHNAMEEGDGSRRLVSGHTSPARSGSSGVQLKQADTGARAVAGVGSPVSNCLDRASNAGMCACVRACVRACV